MITFKQFISEGTLRSGYYQLGNHPTSRDRGLAFIYNTVIPELAQTLGVPKVAIKVASDYGFGWSPSKLYSIERVLMRVVVRKRGEDVELMAEVLPRVLHNLLSQQLEGVKVGEAKVTPAKEDHDGKVTPPHVDISFTAKYPQSWLDWDKKRYNISW